MGRHAAPAPPPEPPPGSPGSPTHPGPTGPTGPDDSPDNSPDDSPDDSPEAPDASGPGPRAQLVLALAAAVSTVLATSWSGLPWRDAGLSGVAVALLVVVSARVAGTMPPRPTPYSDARDSDRPHE